MKFRPSLHVYKRILVYSFLVLCWSAMVLTLRAQNLVYAKGLNNIVPLGGDVVSRSIKVDHLGNTYVTGNFRGKADFDPGDGVAYLTGNFDAQSQSIFFAKYDAAGNYIFAKGIVSRQRGQGNDITVAASGEIYVTGFFSLTADFDPGPGEANLNSDGDNNIFVACFDASGNYLYAHSIGSSGNDMGTGIALDGEDNVYITGSFTGGADFDPDAGLGTIRSAGSEDVYIAKYNRDGNFVYAKGMGGTASDISNNLAVDASGNVYITGFFRGTADFDPGAGVSNRTSLSGSGDIFIARYDAAGNYVYVNAVGSPGSDMGNDIAVDGSGNAYVTGNFEGTVDFDPGSGIANLSAASSDIFVARYDAAGNYVYAKRLGGGGTDGGNGIAVDGAGHASVTGFFNGTADFDPGAGVVTLTSAGNEDIFVAKYDVDGNYIYAKVAGGIAEDIGYGITLDTSGQAHCTGNFHGTADFDPGPLVTALAVDGNRRNGFFFILSDTGNYVRATHVGINTNTALQDEGRSIAVDVQGNTYVTGFFTRVVDFDPGPGKAILTSVGARDIFLAKYDAGGNYVYAKTMPGTDIDVGVGNGIAVDQLGNVYITGYFSGLMDFDPGNGEALLSSTSNDIFVACYDPLGNYKYAHAIGGAYSDFGNSIAVDVSGNVFVTGSFSGTADFDPGPGTAILRSTGTDGAGELFVAKYDASGHYLFAKSMGGSLSSSRGSGIGVDKTGSVYVTGSFQGNVDFDPGPGTAFLTSAGSTDVFIAKYDPSGGYVYAKAMGGNNTEYSNGIAVDGFGHVYITGAFTGMPDFDPGPGTAFLSSTTNRDIFVARYDADGNYVYANAITGQTVGGVGHGIAADGSGSAYITGSFAGTVDFDPGPGVANLTSSGVWANYDIFVARYDPLGNYVYAKAMGGELSNEDVAYGIALDVTGSVHLTGSFGETANFDVSGTINAIIEAGNVTDIFIAKYGPSGPLPVDLLNFTARAISNDKAVQVSWTTASETNNSFFEVERSKDGVRFEAIGRRPGCSTCKSLQQYDLIDNNPYNGLSYYRLKQVDHDAKFSYSSIVPLSISTVVNTSIRVYPNMTNGAFELRIQNNPARKQVVIRLLNSEGRLINQQAVWLNEGDNRFTYTLADQASGLYYISVSEKGGNAPSTVMVVKK